MATIFAPWKRRFSRRTFQKSFTPADELEQGRELRLKQQYFFVAATFLGHHPALQERETAPFAASGARCSAAE
jgi:hypothetical protein